jgi:hypothetical protein
LEERKTKLLEAERLLDELKEKYRDGDDGASDLETTNSDVDMETV